MEAIWEIFTDAGKVKTPRGIYLVRSGRCRLEKSPPRIEKIEVSDLATREGSDGGIEKTAKLMNELLAL